MNWGSIVAAALSAISSIASNKDKDEKKHNFGNIVQQEDLNTTSGDIVKQEDED